MSKTKKSKAPRTKAEKLRAASRLAGDVLMWLIGVTLYSLSVTCFVGPLKLSSGGLTGLGIIVNHLLPVIPIGVFVFVCNVPLFLISWKVFGFKFIARTVIVTTVLSAELDIAGVLAEKYGWIYSGGDTLMGSVFGGVLAGAGLGIVFLAGATTGGMDILARLMRLKFPHISVGKLVLACDFAVVALTGIVYKSIDSILYSLIVIFLSSVALDYVVSGKSHSKMLMIMTSSPDEAVKDIIRECGRGVSILHAEGGYTREEKEMLLCVVRSHEVAHVRKIVEKYDPNPFIIITDSSEVLGQGFKAHDDTL